MATTVSYNGTSYTVPQSGDSGWGTTLTTYLVALASGSLTKAGGLMTLTAELDLGANFGIKSLYFSARGTPATAGAYRLENNTSVSWRNVANDGNLNLTVNSSNALQFNSLPIVALALGAANTVLKMNSGGTAFEYGTLVNANIHASAAIAYSKLNLATSIVNADISASAAIDGSKLVAASASVAGAVTTSAQTFAGVKTLNDGIIVYGSTASPTSIGHTTQGLDLRNPDLGVVNQDYMPPIRWTTIDSTLTTTNPKTLAYIAVKHEEGIGADDDGATSMEFATNPANPGVSAMPIVRMTIASDGAVTLGNLAGTGTRMVTASSTGVLSSSVPLYGISNESQSGIASNTMTDVGSSTITVPAGTYLISVGGHMNISQATFGSYHRGRVVCRDSADTVLTSGGNSGMSITSSTSYSGIYHTSRIQTFGSTTTLKISAQLVVTGGTGTAISVGECYLTVQPIL